jgi:hypothetical protein
VQLRSALTSIVVAAHRRRRRRVGHVGGAQLGQRGRISSGACATIRLT